MLVFPVRGEHSNMIINVVIWSYMVHLAYSLVTTEIQMWKVYWADPMGSVGCRT